MIITELYQRAFEELSAGRLETAALKIKQAARELAAIGRMRGAEEFHDGKAVASRKGVAVARRKLERSEYDDIQFQKAEAMLKMLIAGASNRCRELEAEKDRLRKRRGVANAFSGPERGEGEMLDLCR